MRRTGGALILITAAIAAHPAPVVGSGFNIVGSGFSRTGDSAAYLSQAATTLARPPAALQTSTPAPTAPKPPTAVQRPPATPPAPAQPSAAPRPGEMAVEPIRCWWKTDVAEIRVGERFGVTLTCGVVDTRALKVVPSMNQLDPGAVQLTPFEVVSGVRHDDIVVYPHRYFQYEYKVRLLNEGFFGQDVTIPGLAVTFNIQAGDGGSQGRDQRYNLPPLPMRVASLVPRGATDIRDAASGGFGAIDARRFRATGATVAGGILLALAGVLVVVGGVHALGGLRRRPSGTVKALTPAGALNGALAALGRVKADVVRDGWSPALARRAQAVMRIGAAVAMDRPLAHSVATRETVERDGQVRVAHGVVRKRWTLVSGSATPAAIDRALANGYRPAPAVRSALERLRDSLHACDPAAYGREREIDTIRLDQALADGIDAIRLLRRQNGWPLAAAARRRGGAPSTLATASMGGERL
jgi:hypothetical protein